MNPCIVGSWRSGNGLGAIVTMYEGMIYDVAVMKLLLMIVILLIIFGVDNG